MLINSLKATKVYDYLELDIRFNKDITFIVGYNGSGKTTAIKLLGAILEPNLKLLSTIPFESLSVSIYHENKQYTIKAINQNGKITISIPKHEFTSISIASIQHNPDNYDHHLIGQMELVNMDGPSISRSNQKDQNNVIQFISRLPTPFFLGLDRTITGTDSCYDEFNAVKRRKMLESGKVSSFQNRERYAGSLSSGLLEVQNLISERMHYVRTTSDKEYERQRNNFLISSFKYTPYNEIFDSNFNPNMDREVLGRRKEIEHTLRQMKIFDDNAQKEFENFFSSIQRLIDSRSSKTNEEGWHIEWLVNKAQIERMHNFLKIIDDTKQKIDGVSSKLITFLNIINHYYEETGKRLHLDPLGNALIKLPNSSRKTSLDGLSSGERQVLIIFANSILRKSRDNVFIIDEPELSLHLQWQEKLVYDIMKLETGAQYIFATHSPEIIAGNEQKCKEVRK